MKDLIIIATDIEIQPFLAQNGIVAVTEPGKVISFSETIDVLFTGIGMPNTLLTLGRYFKRSSADRVLQLGFAGSFIKDLQPGDMIEVTEDSFGDLGFDDKGDFIPMHSSKKSLTLWAGQSAGWIKNPHRGIFNFEKQVTGLSLRGVKGITVSTGSGSAERINMLQSVWNPDVESMEGAAALLYCINDDLAFRQVRCISNMVEPRDYQNWRIDKAAEALSKWLTIYIENIDEN